MSVKIIVGAQWGDEGKGKIIDLLSENANIVARYQGGANAGHTVIIQQKKYVLHLIPSGILRKDALCLIGNGVVLDPIAFFEELELLESYNIETKDRVFIYPNTHIILSYHKLLDQISESKNSKMRLMTENKAAQNFVIGTTGRGIGPCYADKISRIGIIAGDFFHDDILYEKIKNNIKLKNILLKHYYETDELSYEDILKEVDQYKEKIKNYILKSHSILTNAIKENKNILLEGAQGALLDVDHGTYPFVTSSNPISGGAFTGLGINPRSVNEIIGVVKAYTTRVGEGPFPTELKNEIGESIRKIGSEFGATTGRPRRCGWLDLPALKYSIDINGFTSLAMTKLDVLSQFSQISVCNNYTLDDSNIDYFPNNYKELYEVVPEYVQLEGWNCDISKVKKYSDLPKAAKNYIEYIETETNTKISIISVGADREQTIVR